MYRLIDKSMPPVSTYKVIQGKYPVNEITVRASPTPDGSVYFQKIANKRKTEKG